MPQVVLAIKTIYAVAGFWAAASYTVGFIIGRTLLYIAIGYAANRIGRLFTKKPTTSENLANSGRTLTVREPAASRKIIYGQARVGGVIVYIATSGTTKEYLHLVIAHAGHECEEIGTVYLNDVEVPLDGSGNATGTYAGYVTVKKHLGSTTQTYDTDLSTAVGSGEWGSNHRLRGICYSYLRLKHNPDLFPAGIPNYSALIKGKKVYDPRSATTAWSANAALCLRDYLLDTSLGLGASSGEINDTATNTAANICDESVNLNPSGTEARYTINGVVDTASQPGAVIADMLGAMAGICPYIGGQFNIKAGAHTSSVQTLTIDDARGAIRFTTGDSLRDCFNGVKGVYIAEKNNWQPADFPPVVNSTYTTEDGGNRIWRDIALPFTTSSATAQRLAKIELERSRQDFTVQFPAKLTALNVQVGDVVALTIDRYSWTAKLFEVVDFSFVVDDSNKEAPTLGIDLVLRETASGVWDWNSGEETTVDLAPNSTIASPTTVATPGTPTLSTSNFVQSDGTISPRLRVQWTAPSDERVTVGGYVHIEYKKTADATWLVWSSTLRGNATEDFITDVLAGVSYDVRIRFENVHGVRGSYSSTATATVSTDTTAPGTPSGMAALSVVQGIRVSWAANTDDDLAGYLLHRNTANDFSTSTVIWRGNATAFVDRDVSYGTTYYYWLRAIDRTDNLSGVSSGVSTTASRVATGDIEDGAGTTIKLANGAVSQVTAALASTSSGLTNNAWTEINAITVNADAGQDVIIDVKLAYADDGAAYTTDFDLRIMRDGVEIDSQDQSVVSGRTELIAWGTVDPDLAAGVTEYSLEIRPRGGGGTATPSARDPLLQAIILKDRLN